MFKLTLLHISKILVKDPFSRKDTPFHIIFTTFAVNRIATLVLNVTTILSMLLVVKTMIQLSAPKIKMNQPKCTLCSGPHTANYKGYQVNKYLNKFWKSVNH